MMIGMAIWMAIAAVGIAPADAHVMSELAVVEAQAAHSGRAAPSMNAYQAAHQAVMQGMNQLYSGNADINSHPRHDPASRERDCDVESVRSYGHDPEVRRLAKGVIAAQGREIAQMRVWLGRRDAAILPSPSHATPEN